MNVEQRYNKLVVLNEIGRPLDKHYGRSWVRCRCDCGNEINVALEKVKYGQVKSCGCIKKMRGPDHKDWNGCGEISADYYTTCKRRAKGGGIFNRTPKEFNVSIEYLWQLFLKQNRRCALSGLELTFDPYGKGKKFKATNKVTASLDRIISSKGYVEDNVQWVHKHINIMKNEYSQEQFVEYCKLVAKNNP